MPSQWSVPVLAGCVAATATYLSLAAVLSSAGALQLWATETAVPRPLARGLAGAPSHPTPPTARLTTTPGRRPNAVDSVAAAAAPAPQRAQVVPAAGLLAMILGAVFAIHRLRAPATRPLAAMAATGGSSSADDLFQNMKAQISSAKSQFEGVRDEMVPKLKGQFESAKSQVQTARDQVQTLQRQMEGAKADMLPKLQAELDKSKAALEAARSTMRSASSEVSRILGDDSPLPDEAKVGWLLQNGIGIAGLVAQLWLSAVSTTVGVLAIQLIGAGSSAWAGLLFTTASIAASWYSAYWCFQSHGLGKRLLGDGVAADIPPKDSVLRHLWDGLTLNAAGLLAALFGTQINTGLLYMESVNAGILNTAGGSTGMLHKGVSAFDVFAQLAQSQALLSLSLGLLLALVTLRVASRPKAPATA